LSGHSVLSDCSLYENGEGKLRGIRLTEGYMEGKVVVVDVCLRDVQCVAQLHSKYTIIGQTFKQHSG